MPQTTLQHIHLKQSRTTSISALGEDIDKYLKQYSDDSNRVVKELGDFLTDYRKPLQDFEDSKVWSTGNKIHTFFLTYTGKLSERLITEANQGEDLATVWRNFADESLGKKRLKRVQILENEFPDWPTENLKTLIENCTNGNYFQQSSQSPNTNEAGSADQFSDATIDPKPISTNDNPASSFYTVGDVDTSREEASLGSGAGTKRAPESLESDDQPSEGKKARA